jgi:hypothetical protein
MYFFLKFYVYRTGFKIAGCIKLADLTFVQILFAEIGLASFNFAVR